MRGWAGVLRAAVAGPGPVPGGFRERFDFGGRDVASWFPGHMAKGLRQMRASLRRADCLVEVHDARIPLSGRNPMLQEALGIRPHILVLNKMDLADPRRQPTVLEHLKQRGCSHVVFTDCQRDGNVKKIVPLVAKLVGNSPRYHRAEVRRGQQNCQCMCRESGWPSAGHLPLQLEGRGCLHAYQKHWQRPGRFAVAAARHSWGGWLITGRSLPASFSLPEHRVQHPGDRRAQRGQVVAHQLPAEAAPQKGYFFMVPGLREEPLAQPWSGRQGSALLASLTVSPFPKGKATAVGGEPGITKAVLTRIQVCEKPLMYLVDTPGVLPPKLGDVETGMKLALCGAIRDHLVGEDIMADYLLYALNKRQQFGYVRRYGLAEACDDIEPVLRRVALAQGRTQKVKVLTGTGNVNVTMLNYPAAAYEFLQDFRAGRLGRVTLD
ncbi:mitochondrial ribosome-associated GTPase 1 isoform X1 [Aptenodytes patagonicus]|uniref:mitochondrial ribosome-associated GTPase 1 isoform X1 n=1 Tax=Aptenodytes patagonicus TaxID=9234 RepID=UPI003FA14E7F